MESDSSLIFKIGTEPQETRFDPGMFMVSNAGYQPYPSSILSLACFCKFSFQGLYLNEFSPVAVKDLYSLLDHAEDCDLRSWRFKNIAFPSAQKKVTVFGFLGALEDGSPCLLDRTGSLALVISRACAPAASLEHQKEHLPFPHYGNLVAISKFLLVMERSEMAGFSKTYMIVHEVDLFHLTTGALQGSFSPPSRLHRIKEDEDLFLTDNQQEEDEEGLRWWLSVLVVVVQRGWCQESPTGLGYQWLMDVMLLSKCLMEVDCQDDPKDGERQGALTTLQYHDFLPHLSDTDLHAQQSIRRKRLVLGERSLWAAASYMHPGRVYQMRVPVVGCSNSAIAGLTKASSFRLPRGTLFLPVASSPVLLCSQHSTCDKQFLKPRDTKFDLLTDNCICPLGHSKTTYLSSIFHISDYQKDLFNILCKVECKDFLKNSDQHHNKPEESLFSIRLLVTDARCSKGRELSVYLNPGILWPGSDRALLPGRVMLLTNLRKRHSQQGNLYLKSTRESQVYHQHLPRLESGEESCPGEMLSLRRLSDLPDSCQDFQSLVTVLRIYQLTISSASSSEDVTLPELDVRAVILVDDGSSQSVVECQGDSTGLLLQLGTGWQFVLWLARKSPVGLAYNKNVEGTLPGDKFLGRLCNSKLIRSHQWLLTCRRKSIKDPKDGMLQRLTCRKIREAKAVDMGLSLLPHMQARPIAQE